MSAPRRTRWRAALAAVSTIATIATIAGLAGLAGLAPTPALAAGNAAVADRIDAAADLPPPQRVEQSIADQPSIRAARAELEAEFAQRARLVAGPYEPLLRAGTQQRRASEPDGRWAEWSLGVERTLRLPGKAALDESLGEQGVRQARAALGEARHEAGRALLADWFAWLREATIAREWGTQRALLDAQRDGVRRRERAGDASRLEVEQAEAAWEQADAQRALADARAAQAGAELARRYRIDTPDGVRAAPVPAVEGGVQVWIERVLGASHELALAREASARALIVARRADADRSPDPSVGIHVASERGGAERIVGVALSIPLPGAARVASVDAARAQARAGAAREAAVRRRLEAEVEGLVLRAAGAREGWQRLAAVAERLELASALSARAYSLGEGTVAEVLTARRLAADARIAAAAAGVDAALARYRLLLDAHELWDIDDDD